MTNQNVSQAIILEYGRNFSVENGPCISSGLSFYIHALIIQPDILHYLILTVMSYHYIRPCNRNRKCALVPFEGTRQTSFVRVHLIYIHLFGLFLSG